MSNRLNADLPKHEGLNSAHFTSGERTYEGLAVPSIPDNFLKYAHLWKKETIEQGEEVSSIEKPKAESPKQGISPRYLGTVKSNSL